MKRWEPFKVTKGVIRLMNDFRLRSERGSAIRLLVHHHLDQGVEQ